LSLSQLNIDFFGFIFYEKSPRYFLDNPVDLNKDLNSVGVFVNLSIKKKVKLENMVKIIIEKKIFLKFILPFYLMKQLDQRVFL